MIDEREYMEIVRRLQEWAKNLANFLDGGMAGPAPRMDLPLPRIQPERVVPNQPPPPIQGV